MKYTYTAIFEPDGSGGYNVRVPDLPGCISHGDNLYDAIMMGTDAMSVWLAASEEAGDSIPAPRPPQAVRTNAPAFSSVLCADTEAYRQTYPPGV